MRSPFLQADRSAAQTTSSEGVKRLFENNAATDLHAGPCPSDPQEARGVLLPQASSSKS